MKNPQGQSRRLCDIAVGQELELEQALEQEVSMEQDEEQEQACRLDGGPDSNTEV